MKINKLLVAALTAGMMFASCSSDDEGTKGSGEETFAGFNITLKTNGTNTRADGKDYTSTMESKVNSIGIYIWDAGTALMHYKVLEMNAGNFSTAVDAVTNEVTYSGIVTVKTTVGTKDVLVVANPTDAVTNEIAVRKGGVYGVSPFGVAKSSFFNNSIPASPAMVLSGVKRTVVIGDAYKDETHALNNLIDLTIDRNLAKVVVRKAWTNVTGGTVDKVQYALIAEANDAYFLPQTNTLYASVPDDAIINSNNSYYDNFSSIAGVTYQDVLADNTTPGLITANGIGFYCFENKPLTVITPGETPFRRGNTTAARIKLEFTPTAATVVTAYSENPPGTPIIVSTGTIAAGTTFHVDAKFNHFWTDNAMNNAITDGYFTADQFKTYTNGICYYTIPVQNTAGVIGVVRNNLYALDITDIKGPGLGAEPTEEKEPYTEDAYLAIKATALNWNFEASGHVLQ